MSTQEPPTGWLADGDLDALWDDCGHGDPNGPAHHAQVRLLVEEVWHHRQDCARLTAENTAYKQRDDELQRKAEQMRASARRAVALADRLEAGSPLHAVAYAEADIWNLAAKMVEAAT